MNAVEIEEAVSTLAEAPFDPKTFPFAFLEAFGNKETTLKRLKTGTTNQSDIGGILQRNNIHLKVCPQGQVPATLSALRQSPATARQKAKFILATDGNELHAENLLDDVPPLACDYTDFPNHFAFFLPLAGITTVRQIAENAFDIRATGRLNRLYVELLKHNPDWDTDARRADLNHFFARLIFCFFAEDTGKRLRDRLSRIRVFDPACGSGNFLVIAYKEMRHIEAIINQRRGGGEHEQRSVIPSTNFRGIEIRHFAAEIARLALVIAKFQCDALHISDLFARKQLLPLDKENWITCGNALRLDWLELWDVRGTGVKLQSDDLFETPLSQTEMDFENAIGETYVCANPPYQGSVNQSEEQKWDMAHIFAPVLKQYKDLDYVAAFMLKAARFNKAAGASSAFVATNSITQGEQVAMLWPLVFQQDNFISFAHTSFMWSNLASNKAAVTCVILGLTTVPTATRQLFDDGIVRSVGNISPYLVASDSVIVSKRTRPLSEVGAMQSGNKPTDDGNFILDEDERAQLLSHSSRSSQYIKRYVGSKEIINGGGRWCIWVDDHQLDEALQVEPIRRRIENVQAFRGGSRGKQANENAANPHRFVFAPHSPQPAIAVPNVSSIRRPYLPCELTSPATVVSNLASVIYDAPLWNLALVASRLHLVWIGTVCGKLKTDYRYSNTLGWNTFPVPPLSDSTKSELTRRAEDILLAREAHFPATIADLYDPDHMPADLRAAHDRNDETLERIYIGRRFKNDTERLEKLFEMYTQMTASRAGEPRKARGGKKKG